MSSQFAFEMFAGNGDTETVREIGRVLKDGGAAVILPLYMHKQLLSAMSPNYYGKGNGDPDAIECIRKDCWSWIPFSRFYDVSALKRRIIEPANESGLMPIVYSILNGCVEKDAFVYLKFILYLKKIK